MTVLLSSQFPQEMVAEVCAVSPQLRVVQMIEGSSLPNEGERAQILAWWNDSRSELAQIARALPNLRWLQSPVAGIGDKQLHEVVGTEVLITSAAGVYADLVAEHALTLLLALYRRLPDLLEQQHRGVWQDLTTRSPIGETLGIIGAGGIGRVSARLARAFGMRVIGIHRGLEPVPELDQTLPVHAIDDLFGSSDVVLLAAPLTPETRGLVNAAKLRTMKPTSYLINVARGPLVVTDDLTQALHEGWIAGAGLDVTDPEPLPHAHPLWQAPNLIITPHHANPPQYSVEGPVRRFCENLRRYLDHESLLAMVDASRGY